MDEISRADKELSLKVLYLQMATLLEAGHDEIANGQVNLAKQLALDAATLGEAIRILDARDVEPGR